MWLCACGPEVRPVDVTPSLGDCLAGLPVNEVKVTGLGDFPPAAGGSASATPTGTTALTLPDGTRVVEVDGAGPGGLAAFGRTPTVDLSQLYGTRIAVAYGPLDGLCTTGKMNFARAGHHATALTGGAVLISGGVDAEGFAVSRLEIYEPLDDAGGAAATFRIVDLGGATALDARAALGNAVAALADGGALITGGAPARMGKADGIAFEGVSRHGPDGKRVTAPAILAGGPRAFHTATTLPDGRVLVAGGCDQLNEGACSGTVLDTTVIYDPVADAFSDGPTLLHARWDHAAASLGDGRVLISGGLDATGATPPLEVVALDGASDAGPGAGRAAALPTGSVALVDASSAVTLYAGDGLVPLQPLPTPHAGAEVVALEDGSFLVAGGISQPLEVYDAVGQPTALMPYARLRFAAARVGDGSVLLAGGGSDGTASTDAFIYLRSPVGPYVNLPTLTFDSPSDPFMPRRPDRAVVANGRLRVAVPDGGPSEYALAAGMMVGDFSEDFGAGLDGPTGVPQLLLGWRSAGDFRSITLQAGTPVALDGDPACTGAAPDASELPLADVGPVRVGWRSGRLTVGTPTRTWLDCRPAVPIARGALGLGAAAGTVLYDNWTITR
jgi:hypothetical protein